MTVNLALVVAVVALVAATTGLGTWMALRALPAGMPRELHRLSCAGGISLGAGLGGSLCVAVVVASAGLGTRDSLLLEALLGAAAATMIAEHAAFARWLRWRWVMTAALPPVVGATPVRSRRIALPPTVALTGAAAVCAAVLLAATALDTALPRWTLVFGAAAAAQALGIIVVTAPRRLRVAAR